jgi:hypothetical protein
MRVSTRQSVLPQRSRAFRVSIARTRPMSRPTRLDACRESNSLQSAQRSAAHHERSVKIGCGPMMSIRVIIRSRACCATPMPVLGVASVCESRIGPLGNSRQDETLKRVVKRALAIQYRRRSSGLRLIRGQAPEPVHPRQATRVRAPLERNRLGRVHLPPKPNRRARRSSLADRSDIHSRKSRFYCPDRKSAGCSRRATKHSGDG